MIADPTRGCELLVGLPDVAVLGVVETRPLLVHVEALECDGCGGRAWVKEHPEVELVDLPVFGRQARLV